jgi:hypothetical protein
MRENQRMKWPYWTVMVVLLTGCVSSGGPTEIPVNAEADHATEPATREQWESRVPENLRDRRAFAYVEEDPSLPRVLLIGDSISIGYTPSVRRLLAGQANVLRVPANAGPTTRGFESIDAWLGEHHWDVIHFNWGLHDLKRLKNGKLDVSGEWQVDPEQYRLNLEILVRKLKATGAKLIWASTTPVPDGANGRIRGDEVRYNAIAARIMKRQRVRTNDLYAAVVDQLAEYQRSANVHFSEEGSAFLGERVAAAILDAQNFEK